MNRWHRELPLMQNRWRVEKHFHKSWGEKIEECHCFHMGTHRKCRPLEGGNRGASRMLHMCEKTYPKKVARKARRAEPFDFEEGVGI